MKLLEENIEKDKSGVSFIIYFLNKIKISGKLGF